MPDRAPEGFSLPPLPDSETSSTHRIAERRKLFVERIIVDGNTVLSEEDLRNLLQPYVGREVSEQLGLGLVVSVVTEVLTSIFVPILSEQNIIPESWVEIRLFAIFVAGIFAGYLIGTMVGHVIFLRQRSFMRDI